MAIKKGICKNYGECDIADSKNPVVQEADSSNFVCECCGAPLYECAKTPPPSTSPLKKILIGVAGAAVLGGGAGYFLLQDGSDKQPKAEAISLSRSSHELITGLQDTLQAKISPEGSTATLRWATSDSSVITVANGIVTAVAPGKAKIGVQIVENKKLKAFCEYTILPKGETPPTPPTPTPPTPTAYLDLGYGTYTGPTKNGKPHGMGRLVYKRTTIINRTDSKQRTAQRGESIQGQFVNGTFTIGKHFDTNGNLIESLNFGVAN